MSRLKYIVIGLILVSGIAVASELMSFAKYKFSGLNTSVNIRLLQDDEASDISNFSLDEIGSIKERDLFGQYNSSSGALGSNFITGLFKHYTSDSKFFIACAGSKVGLGSGGIFTDITPSTNTVTSGKYWSGLSFDNNFYMFNPSIPMAYYKGSGGLNIPASTYQYPGTNCSYGATHKGRVWAARSDSLPYRIYYSSLSNPLNWTATGGFIDLPDVTQEITGLISWGGYLYIFTETNIYILLGSTPNDFSLRKTNSMVGAIAPRSIEITDVGICYLSRSGVYAFDGNNSNKISIKIDSTINGISKTLIQNACAIYDGKRYWLSYTPTGGSYNSRIILYDIYLKDWVIYQGDACNISYFERAYGGTDKGELYGGSSTTNGIVYQLQASGGTESITHNTKTQFNNNSTYNTTTWKTESSPIVEERIDYHNGTHYPNLNLYLPFDGDSDDYSNNHSLTLGANASVNTSTKKFNSGSLSCNGSDSVTIADSSDWDITGNYTISMWVKLNSHTGTDYFVGQFGNAGTNWRFVHIHGTGLQFLSTGQTRDVNISGGEISDTNWHHIAYIQTTTTEALYLDGVRTAYVADSGTTNMGQPLAIGGNSAGALSLDGYIDMLVMDNSNLFNINPNSTITDIIQPHYFTTYGITTSPTIQINAAGATTLDKLSWVENLFTNNNKVTFQTRTGATNDSVYFNGWQYWSSANSVTLSTVTNATTMFIANGNITIQAPIRQIRNELYYEDEDSVSVNCAQLQVYGAKSTNAYVDGFLTYTDLSDYDWLTIWFKSPATGNSVEFYMSNNEGQLSNNSVTFNSVTDSTVTGWQKAFWYIGNIADSEKNGIRYIRMKYKGDVSGYLYLGEVEAHNYYDSTDTMTSTPNDWIQYRGILGTTDIFNTPQLSSVTLIYTPALSVSEDSLSSYYYTKWFDFKTPQLNKQFDSLVLEMNSTSASTVTGSSAICTVYCDYDIDFGTKTGTLSFLPTTTANTVRILKNFPSSTYGKAMRLKIYNNNKDAQVTIKGTEIRYRTESATPD